MSNKSATQPSVTGMRVAEFTYSQFYAWFTRHWSSTRHDHVTLPETVMHKLWNISVNGGLVLASTQVIRTELVSQAPSSGRGSPVGSGLNSFLLSFANSDGGSSTPKQSQVYEMNPHGVKKIDALEVSCFRSLEAFSFLIWQPVSMKWFGEKHTAREITVESGSKSKTASPQGGSADGSEPEGDSAESKGTSSNTEAKFSIADDGVLTYEWKGQTRTVQFSNPKSTAEFEKYSSHVLLSSIYRKLTGGEFKGTKSGAINAIGMAIAQGNNVGTPTLAATAKADEFTRRMAAAYNWNSEHGNALLEVNKLTPAELKMLMTSALTVNARGLKFEKTGKACNEMEDYATRFTTLYEKIAFMVAIWLEEYVRKHSPADGNVLQAKFKDIDAPLSFLSQNGFAQLVILRKSRRATYVIKSLATFSSQLLSAIGDRTKTLYEPTVVQSINEKLQNIRAQLIAFTGIEPKQMDGDHLLNIMGIQMLAALGMKQGSNEYHDSLTKLATKFFRPHLPIGDYDFVKAGQEFVTAINEGENFTPEGITKAFKREILGSFKSGFDSCNLVVNAECNLVMNHRGSIKGTTKNYKGGPKGTPGSPRGSKPAAKATGGTAATSSFLSRVDRRFMVNNVRVKGKRKNDIVKPGSDYRTRYSDRIPSSGGRVCFGCGQHHDHAQQDCAAWRAKFSHLVKLGKDDHMPPATVNAVFTLIEALAAERA